MLMLLRPPAACCQPAPAELTVKKTKRLLLFAGGRPRRRTPRMAGSSGVKAGK